MKARDELDRHVLDFTEDGPPRWVIYKSSDNLAEERFAAELLEVEHGQARARRRREAQMSLFEVEDIGPDGRRRRG